MFARTALFGPRVVVGLILLGGSMALGLASGASSGTKARAIGLEPTSVTQVSAGGNHTCALFAGGTIECWGANRGLLGNALRSQTGSPKPVPVTGMTDAVQISAGTAHTCALISDGTVECWGWNDAGQLGNGATKASAIPIAVIGITSAIQVSAGGGHTCAVLSDAKVKCWGYNGDSQLGDGVASHGYTNYDEEDISPIPVEVTGLTNATRVSAGVFRTCAVLLDGKVKCWGGSSRTPVEVSGIANATQISAGGGHTCALLSDHTLKCWGGNHSGQLGNGTTTPSSTPVEVSGISGAIQVDAGSDYTCAVIPSDPNHPEQGGTVKCWGGNGLGQLGDTTTTDSSTPVAVSGISIATEVSAGGHDDDSGYTCALLSDHTVKCWGYNNYGQLGNGKQGSWVPPVEVSGIANATQISAGNGHTCAVLSDGKVKCWGYNHSGQLGNGTTIPSSTPVEVSGIRKAVSVSAIGGNDQVGDWRYQTCAILVGGAVRCWGDGPLGNGKPAKVSSSVPVAVRGIKKATTISGNYGFDRLQRCVVIRGGTIKCWGFGQRVPVAVHGIRNAVSVSVGDDKGPFCALLRGGKIECTRDYADRRRGRAGYEDPGITNARMISSGEAHTCVALSGGKAKCWGSNNSGQLGNGRRNSSGLPVTVKGIGNAIAVSASDSDFILGADGFTCAVLRSGRVKCWGDNWFGQLGNLVTHYGDYSLAERNLTPVQVSGITNATQVSAGAGYACALLSDGKVKCWGADGIGQLGDGGKAVNPTPVDVIGLS
jgi:alpha-tubulin suppressor-like RCC1 family protein